MSMYGEYPHNVAHDAYGVMYLYKKAIEKAKTIETDAVIEAMETMEFDTPGYKRKMRKEDHSVLFLIRLPKLLRRLNRYESC
jgi:branched-chain amino acid transport system substrate-binding protein